jgi:hypothetical protein
MAVVNSSQGKHPCGDDLWVSETCRAISTLEDRPVAVLSSLGAKPWELACWAACSFGLPQIIAIPCRPTATPSHLFDETVHQFNLDAGKATLVFLPIGSGNAKAFGPERDRLIFEWADGILPVSIRPRGNMDALLAASEFSPKINSEFRTAWTKAQKPPQYRFQREQIKSEMDPPFRGWLFHWTRAAGGPWRGETLADYYQAIAESRGEYPRSARRTLDRILEERKLRSTSWRIRGGQRTVSFTALPPSEAVALMRWRRRYVRYTVEPYGVAIHPCAARESGIRPVSYIPWEENGDEVPEYLLQGRGLRGDWPLEKEHRHLGDLDLSRLPEEAWRPVDLDAFLAE